MMTPTDRRARRALRRWALVVILVISATLAALGGLYAWGLAPVFSDRRAAGGYVLHGMVEIQPGDGLNEIAELLGQQGWLRSRLAFRVHALVTGQAGELKSGVYEVSQDMSVPEIIQMLAEGRQATVTVTMPEGFTIAQIAKRLAQVGLGEEQRLRTAATAPAIETALQPELPDGLRSAEGYLFPETYNFALGTTADQVVARMVEEFETRFVKGPWQAVPAEARWGSLHEVVTLASLVEEEAQIESERPLIAGVLRNRLQRGMRLECDATVLYALGEHRARLTHKDLQVDSPYNTYRHTGLPPGPISNPGLACLQAALTPAHTEYLFYVARGDGSHIFSRTYEQHLAAIGTVRGETER